MGIINRLLIHLIGSKGTKIHSEFGDVIVQTTKEIGEIPNPNKSIQELMISWCVSLPWAYFETLFINEHSWNKPLSTILDQAEIINGIDCALITQAFCLWQLEQLINNDINYQKFSIKEIEQYIYNNISKGPFLIEKLYKFRQELKELSPDDWYFKYIHEILNVLYNKGERISSMVSTLSWDSELRLGLMICSIEMVKSIKQAEAN